MVAEEVRENVKVSKFRGKVTLERRDASGDIIPIWECPVCGGEVDVVHKEECTSLDVYKQCLSCGFTFKEVWIIERIEEVNG